MGNDSDSEDKADMLILRMGDDFALNDIMDRWGKRLIKYFYRELFSESDASELTQEVFIRIYRARFDYRPTASFATWIFTIARNLLLNRQRWYARHPEAPATAGSEPVGGQILAESIDGMTPTAVMIAQEEWEAVRDAIRGLPNELRTALILSEYEGLSQADIAAIQSCSIRAVEGRLYRARQALRGAMESWRRQN